MHVDEAIGLELSSHVDESMFTYEVRISLERTESAPFGIGLGTDDWTPQFRYWQRPPTLDDGGVGVVD